MKLFKSLLVAPATLGLLAPMSATANEITINDFNPVIQETLLAGGEGLVEGVMMVVFQKLHQHHSLPISQLVLLMDQVSHQLIKILEIKV